MPFTIHASIGQQTGFRKGPIKSSCNDVLYCRNTPTLLFYGLADGQGSKQFGATGGSVALHTVAAYIQETGLSAMLEYPFPDEIPFLLAREFRKSLHSLARQRGHSFSEYASTILGIAIDPLSGNYLVFHLGDGCAIGIHNNNSSMILSPPENTYSPEYTWLTTSDHAAFHLRISYGNIQNFQRLVLLTDGATSLCHGKNISSKAKQLLADKDPHQLLNALKQAHQHDDASGIVLNIHFQGDSNESNRTEQRNEV